MRRPVEAILWALVLASCTESHVGFGEPCISDRECSVNELVCDARTMTCVECRADSDCLVEGELCRGGICEVVTPCTSSRQCPGRVCDPARSYCVDCVMASDCSADQECVDGSCRAPVGCSNDSDCRAPTPVCDGETRTCVGCLADEHCGAVRCVDRQCAPTDGGRSDAGRDAGGPDGGADGGAADAGSDAGAPRDAGTSCAFDDFDGGALASHWVVAAGAAPTYTIAGSRLIITDAPFSETPSQPTTSWIYDPAVDRGNQWAWNQPLGTADFTLDFECAWDSDDGQLTLAGVGVTDAANQLLAYAGIDDDHNAIPGTPFGRVGMLQIEGAVSMRGSAVFRIERRGDIVRIYTDGTELLSAVLTAAVEHLVIFAARHRSDRLGEFEFGTAELGYVRLCRP